MIKIDIKKMLESGLQFGHLTATWNPANKNAIRTKKNGIHVFDLKNTAEELRKALFFVAEMVEKDQSGMIVATRIQAREACENLAKVSAWPAVLTRWVGGTITNFDCIKKRSQTLANLTKKFETGMFDRYTKKEKAVLNTKRVKLARDMRGLENLAQKPNFVFVASALKDSLAVREAQKSGVKVIAIVDSNADPAGVDFPIHANDDAKASVDYIFGLFVEVVEAAQAAKKIDEKKEK